MSCIFDILHNLVHGTNASAINSVIPTKVFQWINHKHSHRTQDFNSLELLNSGQTDMGLKYSNFRFCFTRGTDSKASYTVLSHVNCETGNITYQVGTDGEKQLHCTKLFTDLILWGLLLTIPQNCYCPFCLVFTWKMF